MSYGRRWEEPPMFRRHMRELGYRSTDMLLFAALWLRFGIEILLGGDPDPSHKVPLEYLGEGVRAGVWFAAAGLGVVCAFMRDHDWLGFGALMVPCVLRVFSFGFAWLYGLTPVGDGSPLGDSGAWLDTLTWIGVTLIVWRAAKRPELPELPDDEGRWPWQ